MAIQFPSLEFFEALKKRTAEDSHTFEKLGFCDANFGVRVGENVFAVRFDVYECVEVAEGKQTAELDFVLTATPEVWADMVSNIVAKQGADAEHTLNTLSHLGDVIRVDYDDPEGHDRFYRFMATIQEFFDQARYLDVEVAG